MAVQYKAGTQDIPILDTITARLRQGVHEWYGGSSGITSSAPEIRSYTNSFLLRYAVQTPKGPKNILVKIRRNPKMETLAQAIHAREIHGNISAEYNTVKFVHERIGEGHINFTAIRPLAYFEEYFAIVMEEFPSQSLRHLLYKHRKSDHSDEVRIAARKAGELLRFFHEQVHSITEKPYSTTDLLADVESYTSRLERYTRGRVNSGLITDAFRQHLASREIHSMPFSEAHQDMTCDNILYSENGKVCLIDIKTRPAPIYSDLALLIVHPETFRNQIFRGGRYFSRELLQEYRSAILAGYFEKHPANEYLIHLFCALRVLDKWTMHEELFNRYKRWKRVLTRPLAPFVTSYFQRVLNRYLSEIP